MFKTEVRVLVREYDAWSTFVKDEGGRVTHILDDDGSIYKKVR